MTVRRFVLIFSLALSGCTASQVDYGATAQVAIEQTLTAVPTNTIVAFTATPSETPTPSPSPTPALGIGSSKVRPADNATMLYVPEGEFAMGSSNGPENERPTHTLLLDAFWIDKTEVTTGQYTLCVGAGKCKRLKGLQPSEDSPVVNADWSDAHAYCSFAGGRLPTEAEWEKAARGTDGRIYPWGAEMDKTKVSLFTWDNKMPPVGGFPEGASPYGALDMAGGAFEWVADWYSPSYYAESPDKNPQGPGSGRSHVIRGGWWEWCPSYYVCRLNPTYRSTYRNGTGFYGRGGAGPAWLYYPGAGFRCASGS